MLKLQVIQMYNLQYMTTSRQKISAFDYAFISYNVSHVKDQVMMYVERKGYNLSQTNVNISSLTQHSFNVGMPVPFMIFSKPMSEIMKFNFNPDKN